MSHRRLGSQITLHRIGDPGGRYPIWSDEGAKRFSGRWHYPGDPVIYAAKHYATALLEKLAYLGEIPPNQHRIEIYAPAGATYEVFEPHMAPRWCEPDSLDARAFGHQWAAEKRSLLLFVPSVVAPVEENVIINTAHDAFDTLSISLEKPVFWDKRLFRS